MLLPDITRKRAGFILVAVSILSVVLGAGIGRLQKTANHRDFFDPNDPMLSLTDSIEHAYSGYNDVLLCAWDPDTTILTRKGLAVLSALGEKARTLPYVLSCQSLFDHQTITPSLSGYNAKNTIPVDITTLNDSTLSKRLHRIERDSLIAGRFLSVDTRTASIYISFDLDTAGVDAKIHIQKQVYRIMAAMEEAYPEYDFFASGSILIDTAFTEASLRDVRILVPIMYLSIIFIMFVLLRDPAGVSAIIGVVGLSSLWTMGCAGYLGITLSPSTSIVPIVILTVGIADGIHIILGIYHEAFRGYSIADSIKASFNRNGYAVFITSLTSILGFLSLNMSAVPPFRDMGNLSALGITFSYLLTYMLIPSIITLFPIKKKTHRTSPHAIIGTHIGEFVVRYPRRIGICVSLLILMTSTGIVKLQFDDRFIEYFNYNYRFRVDAEKVMKHLTGLDYIDIAVAPFDTAGISDRAYISVIDSFTQWCRLQPEAHLVTSFTDVIKQIHSALRGYRKESHIIPSASMVRRITRKYIQECLSGKPDWYVASDTSSTRIRMFIGDISSRELRGLEKRIRKQIATLFPEGMKASIGGTSLLFAHVSRNNIQSMLQGMALALAVISLVLMIISRSVKFGLICLVPNVLPALMSFGLWGTLFGKAGLGTSIVFAMTLGIVVDDTVHILMMYLNGIRHWKLSPVEAIQYAFRHVGDAVVLTSAILVVGFGVLTFSGFHPTFEMGLLTAITIVFALVTDIFLLPLLLRRVKNI